MVSFSKLLDRCLDSVKRYTTDYELVIIKGEKGFNDKVNEGIKKAKGDYLIFLHDDVVVTNGWADKLEDCGVFCIREMCIDKEIWGGYTREEYCTDPKETPDYSYFLCLSKEAAKAIYPLDDFFDEPWGQDVDMGLSLRDKGYKIKCMPGKIIHYNKRAAVNEDNMIYLKKKWKL